MRKLGFLLLISGFLFSCAETRVLTQNINDFGRPVYFKEPNYLTNSKTISKIKANETIYKRKEGKRIHKNYSDNTTLHIHETKETEVKDGGLSQILYSTNLINSWYLISNITAGYQSDFIGIYSNIFSEKVSFFLKGIVEIKK